MAEEQFSCPLSRGERILVAVDGSIYSDRALDQAISMATVCNSKFFALTVIEEYPTALDSAGPGVKERIDAEAKVFLDRIKQQAADKNLSCETIYRIGRQPHELIVEEARQKEIDLIVMGTHGRTGLKKFFMGSVTQKVIGMAPCSVLVVPI
jgi:nucleotide-binding universal stress UspA family protein